ERPERCRGGAERSPAPGGTRSRVMPHAPQGKKRNSTKGEPAYLAAKWPVGPLGLRNGEHLEDHPLLVRAEMGVPAIEDQQRAILVAVVPCFMLDRIVEGEGLAIAPPRALSANPESAFPRHDQRQVDDCPNVGDAGVRRNSLAGLQDREKHCRRASWNMR